MLLREGNRTDKEMELPPQDQIRGAGRTHSRQRLPSSLAQLPPDPRGYAGTGEVYSSPRTKRWGGAGDPWTPSHSRHRMGCQGGCQMCPGHPLGPALGPYPASLLRQLGVGLQHPAHPQPLPACPTALRCYPPASSASLGAMAWLLGNYCDRTSYCDRTRALRPSVRSTWGWHIEVAQSQCLGLRGRDASCLASGFSHFYTSFSQLSIVQSMYTGQPACHRGCPSHHQGPQHVKLLWGEMASSSPLPQCFLLPFSTAPDYSIMLPPLLMAYALLHHRRQNSEKLRVRSFIEPTM